MEIDVLSKKRKRGKLRLDVLLYYRRNSEQWDQVVYFIDEPIDTYRIGTPEASLR